MDKFWKLLQESTIIQGLLTLLVVGAWLYMLVTGQAIPDKLDTVVGLIVGFYFGAKSMLQTKVATEAFTKTKGE